MATQLQIAKQLNLSKATVSRILSGNTSHDDTTRAKVLALAAQLKYRHLRPTVQSNRGGKKRLTVLGVTFELDDPQPGLPPVVETRVLRGISAAARSENVIIHVNYLPIHERLHLPEHELALLEKGHFAGFILNGAFNRQVVQELTQKVPCVRLNTREPNVDVDCVGQNDSDAVELLIAHLQALGHERIGFFTEPDTQWPARMRQAGYFIAMEERGWEHEVRIITGPDSRADTEGWERCHRRVAEAIAEGVRAWICNHDGVGYALIESLQAQGLSVPQDASICGFDNLEPPRAGLPKITSIEWPLEEIGAAATRRLLRRIYEPAVPAFYMQLNGSLEIGESTGPCSARSVPRPRADSEKTTARMTAERLASGDGVDGAAGDGRVDGQR